MEVEQVALAGAQWDVATCVDSEGCGSMVGHRATGPPEPAGAPAAPPYVMSIGTYSTPYKWGLPSRQPARSARCFLAV